MTPIPRRPRRPAVTLADRLAMLFAALLVVSLLFGVASLRGVWLQDWSLRACAVTAVVCGLGSFAWPYRIQDFLIRLCELAGLMGSS